LSCFEHGYFSMHYAEMQIYENLQGEKRMKQKNRKLKLKFNDMVVELEGCRSLEGRALALMNSLIEARIKFNEISEAGQESSEPNREIEKSKELKVDMMFC